MSAIPSAPERIERASDAAVWVSTARQLEEEQARWTAAGEAGKKASTLARRAQLQLQLGDSTAAAATAAEAGAVLAAVPREVAFNATTGLRAYALSGAAEMHAQLFCSLAFLETGAFPAHVAATHGDAEYVSGLLGAAQDLSRYATSRATAGDVRSVALCREQVAALHAALLEFDFRNGPLRRKFDGLKYAARRLEDMIYEQSLAGRAYAPPLPEESQEGVVESRADDAASDETNAEPCVLSSLRAIRERFELADAARESVIKKSRDVQKA